MVQILPLIGATALFAQTAFGAAVPVKRTQYNNNYGSGSNQDMSAYQQSQDSSQYGNSYNYQTQESNQYENAYQSQDSNQYESAYAYQSQETSQYGNDNAYQTQESSQYGNGYAYQSQDSNQYGNGYETTTSEMAMETSSVEAESAYYSMPTYGYSSSQDSNQYENSYETSSVEAEETDSAYYSMPTYGYGSSSSYETSSVEAEDTSSAYYSMPTYGSGSSQWNSGYNNCVSQCMAQFGAPPSTTSLDAQDSLPSSTGTGAVHTVLVAPTGAGLRYMPFALNATVGDTVRYVWTTPNNHTATLSSALAICNKSGIADQRNFASGVRNASQGVQTFDVTVETAEPQFFYCSVAEHCEKGMFGIINPTNNIGGPNTVGTMMNSWVQSNPSLQAAYSYAMQNISASSAMTWGMGMSLDGIPQSAYGDVAANVIATQAMFAANPNMLETGNGAATPNGSPVVIPPEVNVLLSNTNGTAPTTVATGVTPSTVAAAAATSSLTPVNAQYSGASRSSTGVWVAAVIGVAGWLLI